MSFLLAVFSFFCDARFLGDSLTLLDLRVSRAGAFFDGAAALVALRPSLFEAALEGLFEAAFVGEAVLLTGDLEVVALAGDFEGEDEAFTPAAAVLAETDALVADLLTTEAALVAGALATEGLEADLLETDRLARESLATEALATDCFRVVAFLTADCLTACLTTEAICC